MDCNSINLNISLNNVCIACANAKTGLINILNKIKIQFHPVVISDVLKEVLGRNLIFPGDFEPLAICPKCLRSLELSYIFRKQCFKSEKLINEQFEQNSKDVNIVEEIFDLDEVPDQIKTNSESEETRNFLHKEIRNSLPEKTSNFAPKKASVEMISLAGSYDLNDIIIIENDKKQPSFEGFLKNLGKEVSAEFITETAQENKPSVNKKEKVIATKKLLKPVVFPSFKMKDLTPNTTEAVTCKKPKNTSKTKSNTLKTYLCQKCGLVFNSYAKHYEHLKRHSELRFPCEKCGKAFKTKYILKTHLKVVHSDIKDCLCPFCGERFKYPAYLRNHMKVHSTEKNYVCSYCGNRYSRVQSYNRHLRVHTNVRPFPCNVCGKAFRSRNELRCHTMIHTGVKPHKCKICEKAFIKLHNLNEHLMSHGGRHNCDFCNRNFAEMSSLKRHLKKRHKINYDETITES